MESETDAGYRRPYLDTSVHVADIQNEAGREVSAQILRAAELGDLTIVASTLVIAELVHASGRPVLVTPAQDEAIERRFLNGWTELVELDVAIAIRARRIAREHGLKPADAVHVATAIEAGADVFLSWDDRLSYRDIGKLACRRPYLVGSSEMRPGASEAGISNGGEDSTRA